MAFETRTKSISPRAQSLYTVSRQTRRRLATSRTDRNSRVPRLDGSPTLARSPWTTGGPKDWEKLPSPTKPLLLRCSPTSKDSGNLRTFANP